MKVESERAFALLGALQEQLALYRDILNLEGEQLNLVERTDQIGLLKVMAVKQKRIERIEILNREFAPEREKMENAELGEFSEIDEELDHVLAEIEATLKELVEQESRCVQILQAQQHSQTEQMAHVNRGKQLVSAYKAQVKTAPAKSVNEKR